MACFFLKHWHCQGIVVVMIVMGFGVDIGLLLDFSLFFFCSREMVDGDATCRLGKNDVDMIFRDSLQPVVI